MEKKVDIHKSAGIIIKDRKFLITRTRGKSFFVSPGGKIEEGETVIEALERELKEELDIEIDIESLENFGIFYAPAQGLENKYLEMNVFIVNKYNGEIVPSREIEEVMWIDSKLPSDIELGSIFKHDILPKLKKLNLID
jgi:8-oxo-dGTP pyrophosphatase MutT (NUDIX family)